MRVEGRKEGGEGEFEEYRTTDRWGWELTEAARPTVFLYCVQLLGSESDWRQRKTC